MPLQKAITPSGLAEGHGLNDIVTALACRLERLQNRDVHRRLAAKIAPFNAPAINGRRQEKSLIEGLIDAEGSAHLFSKARR